MTEAYDIPIVWDGNPEIDVNYFEVYRHSASYSIYSIDVSTGRVALDGNQLSAFPVGTIFNIIGSTNNDGEYVVSTSQYISGSDKTHIYVTGTLPDSTIDGSVYLFALSGKSGKNTVYIDRDLPIGIYYYKVRVIDTMGNASAFSAAITKTSPQDAIAPATPTNMRVRRFDDYRGVKITWDHVTATDMKGYLIWRTFDGLSWHIVGKTNRNEWKDDDVPNQIDKLYNCTFVSYAVSAYDKYNNMSVSTAASDFLTIPLLKSVRVVEDYLALNVYWREPLEEDSVEFVDIWYKKTADSTWIHADTVTNPINAGRIDGPLDEDTEYDVAVSVRNAILDIVGYGTDAIQVTGDWTGYFLDGDTITITGSDAHDGNYTTNGNSYLFGARTVIQVLGSPGFSGEMGNVYNNTLNSFIPQVPIKTIKTADYEQDTTVPVAPFNTVGRVDPKTDRIFISWDTVYIDDDFLRFELYIFDPTYGDYILYGRTTGNSMTINKASVFGDGVPPEVFWFVVAVDRSDNMSYSTPGYCEWFASEYEDGGGLPLWGAFTQRTLSDYSGAGSAAMRRYNLIWNDNGRQSDYFKDYWLKFVPVPYNTLIITAVPGSRYFLITGDLTPWLQAGDTITVKGSTGNDGTWTIQTIVINAGNTEIVTVETFPSAVGDGGVWFGVTTLLRILGGDTYQTLTYTRYNSYEFDYFEVTNSEIVVLVYVRDLFGNRYAGVSSSLIRIEN